MSRQAVTTDAAPAAIGTYSQAIKHAGLLFLSGQIPLHPQSGELVGGGVEAQIRQVFENLAAVADASGTHLGAALKITIYLVDLSHFGRVNEIMADFFPQPYPARAAVGVASLPRGALVEADAIVAL